MHAMRALRTLHAMRQGRDACNDATTSRLVIGQWSCVIGNASIVLITQWLVIAGGGATTRWLVVIRHWFGMRSLVERSSRGASGLHGASIVNDDGEWFKVGCGAAPCKEMTWDDRMG